MNSPSRPVFAALCFLGVLLGASVRLAAETELIVWGHSFDQRGQRAAIARFEKLHPGVKVITSISGRAMDDQKLMCGIAAGSPPDVIRQDRFTIADWAARSAFLPLDEYIRRDRAGHPARSDTEGARGAAGPRPFALSPEDFFRPCWEEVVYQDRVYAIPDSVDNRALYYNKDLLQRAGLVDADGSARPPRTWKELHDYALKLSRRDVVPSRRDAVPSRRDAVGKMVRVGFVPNYGNSWLYMYGWQNGGEFMSLDRRRCTLNDPRIVEALDFMVSIYDALGGADKVDAFSSTFQGGELDPFFTGKIAMKIDGSWVLRNIAENAPNLNFGVTGAPVPEGRPVISWSGGFSLAIPVGAKQPDLAWEFIKWMVSEEAAMIMHTYEDKYSRSRGAPYIPVKHPNERVNKLVYERFVAHNTDISLNLREGYKTFIDLVPVSRFRPVTPVGQLLWDEHVRAFNLAVRHKYSPAEALDRGTQSVQKQLDLILQKTVYPPMNWRYPIGFFAALLAGALAVFAFALRRHDLRRRVFRRETGAGLFFASPWLVGFTLFTAGPILVSIIFSFCRYDVVHPAQFVGLENYRFLLREDPLFWKSLWNTIFLVLGVPLNMIVSLAVAMLLNSKVRGMAGYRTIFYLPAIVPVVASSILWIWVLNPIDGLLNTVIQLLLHGLSYALAAATGWPGPAWLMHWSGPLWLQSEACAKPAIIVMGLWGAGASMIIWLAGLKGIPDHLYEAAEIDGAGRWSQFWHITLPMLSPYIFFNLIMGIIHTFQIFAQAFVMTQGGPADATLFYVYHLFNNAFRFFKMGYASAMAWILFLIVLVLTLIQLKLAPKWVHYDTT